MRTEKEMFALILDTARNDERIRAVYLNGSRANPNAAKDLFQDYDIVYVVTDIHPFLEDENWISVFGDLLICQQPEKLDMLLGKPAELDQCYGYLMLFQDGTRIDLHLETKEYALKEFGMDSLTVTLLDKDDLLPAIPASTDSSYYIKKPTEGQYISTCNDFWWCMQNVAKGIWRHQLPYAKNMLELIIRPHLDNMIRWWIGIQNDFQVNVGLFGKYFEKYLPESYWRLYQSTYSGADYQDVWATVFHFCELFRILAKPVGKSFGFTYPQKGDENMTAYLRQVSQLSENALDMKSEK